MNPKLEAVEIGIACAKQVAPEAVAASEGFLTELWGKIFGAGKSCDAVTKAANTAEHASTSKVSIPFFNSPDGHSLDRTGRFFAEQHSLDSIEARIYARNTEAVVRLDTTRLTETNNLGQFTKQRCTATGFLLKGDIVATNYHAVKDSLIVPPQIILHDGTKLACQLLARDKIADLALLKIINKPESLVLQTMELAPVGKGATGLPIYSIGHPSGVVDATMGKGKVLGTARWTASEALDLSGNEAFQRGYAKMKRLYDWTNDVWTDKNPRSIRNAAVFKLETSVPSLGGSSGSPVLDSSGAVRGIVSHGAGFGANCTHVDHLHALLKALPNRPLEDGWLDVFTKPKLVSNETGKISVSTSNVRQASWSKATGMFSRKLDRLKELDVI